MIEHNPPAFRQSPKDKRESPVWIVRWALQLPPTQHNGSIDAEGRYLEIGKGEHAHLRAIGIFLFVTLTHCFPASPDFMI